MSETKELALVPAATQPIAPIEQAPSVTELFRAITSVIQSGNLTAEGVAAAGEAMKLCERMEARNAERAFAQAFVALQADLRSVKAVRPVPNKDGSVRYKFAPFEDIMDEVGPKAEKHGFTITFSTDYAEGRLIKTCTLQHISGHSKSNKFAVRVGGGPPGATETQADGAASTYAKRGALCDALNIVIEHDDDARAEGADVTPEQAFELERRVGETNSNVQAFLKFAGAAKFTEIKASKYPILNQFLAKKEGRKQ